MTHYLPKRSVTHLLAALLLAPHAGNAQASSDCWRLGRQDDDSARGRRALEPRVLRAARLQGAPPPLDGTLDHPAWCAASPATDFVQSAPAPGTIATLPSMARVLFDDEAIYVGLRLFDPRPDSIVAPFARRDDETTSDWVFVEIDSRLDRRSAFSFGVNPRGTEVDGTWSDDVNYDPAWNAVWSAAARVDSLGWTAVYRIPFSQLALGRSQPGDSMVWGINFYRYSPHRGESSDYSPRLPSIVGVVSRFNELRGLTVPPRRSRLELVPYTSPRATLVPGTPTSSRVEVGGELHARPTASSTVGISVRPDFGQVESDPSFINLTAFETYLPELRPRFVDASRAFAFPSTLTYASRGTSFDQESPFYSRRIGSPPHGGCPGGALGCQVPTSTSLLGAASIDTRSEGGWTTSSFEGLAAQEHATYESPQGTPGRTQAEPLTSFTALRVIHEASDGRSALGIIGTLVDRSGMQQPLDSLLWRRAMVLGVDLRTRFARQYELTGFALESEEDGSPTSIAILRDLPRHGYDRPDSLGAPLAPSSPLSNLKGFAMQGRLARVAGRFQWSLAGRAVSRGFEMNDVGFQRNADWLLAAGAWSYQVFQPGHWIRRWSLSSRQLGVGWTTNGERRSTTVDLNGEVDLRNYWGGALALHEELPALDPEMLRGGPALRMPAQHQWTFSGYTDARRRGVATLTLAGGTTPETHSGTWSATLDYAASLTDRLQLEAAPTVARVHEAWQYVAQAADSSGRIHYVLGDLHQSSASLTLRASWAFSSRMTVQVYSQPFVAAGAYRGFAEVVQPRAPRADQRVAELQGTLVYDSASHQYEAGTGSRRYLFDDPSFSTRHFAWIIVGRWEFAPGSTLYLVWTQQRDNALTAPFDAAADFRRLLATPATNTLQAKVTYWIAP